MLKHSDDQRITICQKYLVVAPELKFFFVPFTRVWKHLKSLASRQAFFIMEKMPIKIKKRLFLCLL